MVCTSYELSIGAVDMHFSIYRDISWPPTGQVSWWGGNGKLSYRKQHHLVERRVVE